MSIHHPLGFNWHPFEGAGSASHDEFLVRLNILRFSGRNLKRQPCLTRWMPPWGSPPTKAPGETPTSKRLEVDDPNDPRLEASKDWHQEKRAAKLEVSEWESFDEVCSYCLSC